MTDIANRPLRDYWIQIKGQRALPLRSEIDPVALAGFLDATLIAERRLNGRIQMRLAGRSISRQMGLDLRGMPLISLFAPKDRSPIAEALDAVFTKPCTLELTITAAGQDGLFELYPLIGPQGFVNRAIGMLTLPPLKITPPLRMSLVGQSRKLLHTSPRNLMGQSPDTRFAIPGGPRLVSCAENVSVYKKMGQRCAPPQLRLIQNQAFDQNPDVTAKDQVPVAAR